MSDYLKLGDLEVYKIAVELSNFSWEIYDGFDWQVKKVIGDQFIRSVDSVGANIVEGYGRFHHRDKIKFYYNARGSLLESKHWVLLLNKRKIINQSKYEDILSGLDKLHKKLNSYIKSCSKNIN